VIDLRQRFVHGAVGRCTSGGVAIRYVLPVLWMTSLSSVMGCVAYFSTEAEIDIYECLVVVTFCVQRNQAKCIVLAAVCLSVCLCVPVCVSAPHLMLTPVHGPGCNFDEW